MGQVCNKHNEFYEDKCRWCEPGRFEGYDLLPVAPQVLRFKQIPSMAEMLGAETIGPGESKFWFDFINTKYCTRGDHWTDQPKSDPNDGHGALE